jgi:SNF2 family DNA or RNA helicase/tetratricopeptide (TPR) repeat protein
MLKELISSYLSLKEDARRVINFLALTCEPLSLNSICSIFTDINEIRLIEIVKEGRNTKLLKDSGYQRAYIADVYIVIWLFPLISNMGANIYMPERKYEGNKHTSLSNECLLKYLNALCFQPQHLNEVETELRMNDEEQIDYLYVIFLQSAYDAYINRISEELLIRCYSALMKETVYNLDSLDSLLSIDKKLSLDKSTRMTDMRTDIAILQGEFDLARKYSSTGQDESVKYYVEAIFAFIADDMDAALEMFDKGLKKQRRINKNTYIPLLSEAALFYLSACMTKGSDFYMPLFREVEAENIALHTAISSLWSRLSSYNRLRDEKMAGRSEAYLYLSEVCKYCIGDLEKAQDVFSYLKEVDNMFPYFRLWKIIATGFIDKSPDDDVSVERLIKMAFENKYYVLAYEATYLMIKFMPKSKSKYGQMFNVLAAKLNYKPALSRFSHPDEWEKQLNSCFLLDAVQKIMQKEKETVASKERVAYRFYFTEQGYRAKPVLQTCNAAGKWTVGKSITLKNFFAMKIDCMTDHDRRIATAKHSLSHTLSETAIFEMVGHPCVLLKDTDIPVELIAAYPVISAVKSKDNACKIECEINNPEEGVVICKETDYRYRVYNLNAFQCEIINAAMKIKPVPGEGYEKLMRLLKYFSNYVQIQSDLTVDDDDDHLRQVETDSRIRVQLLPMGDGIKAELFVKPFGTHPPYCKPGRGGKSLIATENDERIQVIRKFKDENAYYERIVNDIQTIENINASDGGVMIFDNPLDVLELLDILEQHRDIAVTEWPDGERLRIRKKASFNDLVLKVSSKTNWFEVDGELQIDEKTTLTIGTLLEMIRNSGGRFIELSSGEFLALSDQFRRRLLELAAVAAESKKRVVLNRFASASMMDSFDEFKNVSVDKAWNDFRRHLQTVQLSEAPVPSLLQAELRPYQLSGYQWMIRLSEWGAGACLADDMGLGKTIQSIAVLLHRAHIGVSLVISPVSVMPNWINEINRFAPTLNVKILHNTDRETTLASLEAGDLLVISYGLLLSEEKAVTARHWATVILDEAHAIKNYNTKTSKAAMLLQADFRLILTGTPIQNHLGEMWSLFQFINPGLLGSRPHFTETFIRSNSENARKRLKKLISPFILRRSKTAVLEELPPKTEIVRKIALSDEEQSFYEALRRRAIASLEDDDGSQGAKHLKILSEITRLRQACCNPALVNPEIPIESTKLSTFLEIAAELKDNGHRALVFSQFVSHLSIVRKALDEAGYSYCYLDGSTSVTKRASEVRNFQNGQGDFFLISLKAGGLGLNLTAADYVIHLDPWWNPAIEDQASDRAYRIGQSRPVTVYRLVAEQTIEEKIIQLHNTKRDLADSLLEGSDKSAKLSIDELMSLIKE